MDNLDDSENTAKISDSAYSNSCSNSQSRRSHSSKSTHSGSNSSGSSGYGGKQSTSGSSNNLGQQPKKEKGPKKKKSPQTEIIVPDVVVETEARPPEPAPDFDAPKEEVVCDVTPTPSPVHPQPEKGVENMDIATSNSCSSKDEVPSCSVPLVPTSPANLVSGRSSGSSNSDGFSCVISMHDGVVMYTTSSLTATLGFPKDMWLGRSFIDFIHPRDRSAFASQITTGLVTPKHAPTPPNSVSTMVCRIRRYRGLSSGFGVKERAVTFMPFLLKLSFKDVNDSEGNVIYLVIQATPFFSAFKTPYEVVSKSVPFVIRHAPNGHIEYVDTESVPYLGYLPQDLADKDALLLYHPDDLAYLRQVYEIIVKEGAHPRSRTYRMMAQNGDYLKVETDWSSFINPWSKKLEFVIGKHHIIEGPANPDVFQAPEQENNVKVNEEEKNKVHLLRDNILRTMTEVLTKPAEAVKQQMNKRCQELASFMENLMEEQPKTDDELRIEIQDPDNSYYISCQERDSVMLGGISPHHDYDSKSSTETPLSYNQLNYNETLQRYFESHQPYSYEDYNTATGENIFGLKESRSYINHCLSPMAQHSGDSGEITSSSDSHLMLISSISPPVPMGDYQAIRLTESLLNKHNAEMEKELMKMHRETRSSFKCERDKVTIETRKKKKEHLARCNASFHPTSAGAAPTEHRPHGVKRPSKHVDSEPHKHHCSSSRQARRRQRLMSTSAATAQPSATITTTVASYWPTPPVSNMNTLILGVGIPQQMSIMSPVTAMPGMFPMYYAPAMPTPGIPTSTATSDPSSSTAQHFQPPAMPCMMYGQPMYGPPFMYSPISTQVPYQMHQNMMAQTMHYTNTINPLGLANSNYEETCKPSLTLWPGKTGGSWRDKKLVESQATSSKTDHRSGDSSSSTKALNRESGEHSSQSGNEKSPNYSSNMKSSSNSYCPKSSTSGAAQDSQRPRVAHMHNNKLNRHGNSEETIDKTDGESSYSSFYSSFFKTESGSAEESGDAKKSNKIKEKRVRSPIDSSSAYYEPHQAKKVARRKMEPPWMEQVCVTSELIYKYQILTKTMEEVLTADKLKMNSLEQPTLVNDQLGQLYLDLQLEGVAARLTLEEGITSSSSSGEETSAGISAKAPRRKREYSKLVMIYEEDAPLPPPAPQEGEVVEEADGTSSASTF